MPEGNVIEGKARFRIVKVNGREYEETQIVTGNKAVSYNGIYLDYTIYVDESLMRDETPVSFHTWIG